MPSIASVSVRFSRKYQIRKDDWVGLEALITMTVDDAEANLVDPPTITAEAFALAKAAVIEQRDELRRELAEMLARAQQRNAEIAAPAPIYPPATVAEAKQRFYARYGEIVGPGGWAAVQRFTGIRSSEPASIDEWIAAAQAVRDRAATSDR
jgi:hypothetical protein